MQIILNIPNKQLFEKILWLLNHFKNDGVEITTNPIEISPQLKEFKQINLSELKQIAKEEKELQLKQDKLKEEQNKLYSRTSKIAYQLYQTFIDKNWNCLNRDETYYYLHLEFRSDNTLAVEELKYVDTFSGKIAEFSVVNKFQNRRVNLLPDVDVDDYDSISVLIDKEQLLKLEEIFVIENIT